MTLLRRRYISVVIHHFDLGISVPPHFNYISGYSFALFPNLVSGAAMASNSKSYLDLVNDCDRYLYHILKQIKVLMISQSSLR